MLLRVTRDSLIVNRLTRKRCYPGRYSWAIMTSLFFWHTLPGQKWEGKIKEETGMCCHKMFIKENLSQLGTHKEEVERTNVINEHEK